MGDVTENAHIGESGVIELTGKIMVVAIVLLLFIIVFVFCIHLYAKWFWYRRQENSTATTTTRRRRRLDFAAVHQEIVVIPATRGGLEAAALKTIPVIVYNPKEFKDGLECAVCLCEVSEGEKARILPNCNHGFHLDCIDMWFQSHCTCPLCRNPVSDQNQTSSCSGTTLQTILEAPRAEYSGNNIVFPSESANFPTNVLIWGDETRVITLAPENHIHHHHQVDNKALCEPSTSSSSSSTVPSASVRPGGALVIEIPRQIVEEEEQKSPIPTRLRSLKRLLSGNRRVNPSSPRNLDLEQGGRVQS